MARPFDAERATYDRFPLALTRVRAGAHRDRLVTETIDDIANLTDARRVA